MIGGEVKITRFKVKISCEACGSVNLQVPMYVADDGVFSARIQPIVCCKAPRQNLTLTQTDGPFTLVDGTLRPAKALVPANACCDQGKKCRHEPAW